MRKKNTRILTISSFLIATCFWGAILCFAVSSFEVFSYPAEWEPHEAIWIGFRTFDEGIRHEQLLQQMLRSLAPNVRVRVLVEDMSLLPEGLSYFSMIGSDPEKFDIIVQKPVDFWFRDPGPLFLVKNKSQLAVADFLYSNYADVAPELFSLKAHDHGRIDVAIARKQGVQSFPSHAVLEGGAFEVNGKGTILLTAMTKKRNPHLTTSQLEQEILRTLGQKKIIWLKEGLVEDPRGFSQIAGKYWGRGAGGHTDEFVRFVDDNTVLLAWPTEEDQHSNENPILGINSVRMADNHTLLSRATDQDGKSFNIVHVPVPDVLVAPYRILRDEVGFFQEQDPTLKEGDIIFLTAMASYLNYVITNELILLPSYWRTGRPESLKQKDEQARLIMKKYFPERNIIQIDPTSLNFFGGGMHCITMQQPKVQ